MATYAHPEVLVDWKKDINDPVRRDIVSKEGLEALFGRLGISNDHQIVLYGDFNNWFAAFAFWVFKYYGVEKVVLLNGGRKKWIEEDLPVTKDVPSFPAPTFTAKGTEQRIQASSDGDRAGGVQRRLRTGGEPPVESAGTPFPRYS